MSLEESGFTIVPGPVPRDALSDLADAYDKAMAEADSEDLSIGSTTTRVHDFVNRGAAFDCLYTHPPVLEICRRIIGQPFQLSAMLARTLRPHAPAQPLHVDFPHDGQGWPMAGFIFMIDEFREENGATCFVKGSQGMTSLPASEELTPACGAAGSMIVFNGSVWHGHGANQTAKARRSIQGAYVRRDAVASMNWDARMRPETLARIGPLARYLLGLSATSRSE